MPKAHTVLDLLHTVQNKSAVALSAPARPDLTYRGLLDLIERSVTSLNDLGVGRNDRVAIVLANGPEMATAFIAFAAAATTAPLNPNYRSEEYRFYLKDLQAKVLVVEEDSKKCIKWNECESGTKTGTKNKWAATRAHKMTEEQFEHFF